MDPVLRGRVTIFRRTMEPESATGASSNVNLSSVKSAFAQNTKTFVIERLPLAKLIFAAQDR